MDQDAERAFAHFPGAAAWIYDWLTGTRPNRLTVRQIAVDLAERVDRGRLLDVGCGPGRLLVELHQLCPDLELYGLDISAAMVRLAARNLGTIAADLRCGAIQRTDLPDDFFDAVTCTGSFYLWNEPERSLDEIHRILKPGSSAYLYETYRDHDQAAFREGMARNRADMGAVRGRLASLALRKQLRLTYSRAEIEAIVRRTSFAASSALEPITLVQLPIWLRIRLTKP